MRILPLLALPGAALLAACASAVPPSSGALQGKWQLGDGPRPQYELQLHDGSLSASAGCNRLAGSARIENGRLIAERLASTKMLCAPEVMQREGRLTALLQSKPRIQRQGERLLLGEGAAQLVLTAREDLSRYPTRLIYVGPQRVPCMGVAPMQCLQVRERPGQPWQLHYGEIEGFSPLPGVAYRLRIREVKVANPPADAPDRRWVLDMVVEQEQLTR